MDRILCKGGTLLSCIPEFWLSLVLILVFAVTLHLLPSSGAYDIGYKDDVLNRIEQLILPLVIVVLQHLWYYAYMIRNKLLEETFFEEAELESTDAFVKMKHSKDFDKFKKEILPDGRILYTFDNGSVAYSYEFTEI